MIRIDFGSVITKDIMGYLLRYLYNLVQNSILIFIFSDILSLYL